jgi:dihydroflavonol-4-reductase
VAQAALAAGAKRLVYTSSIAALGLPTEGRPLNEEDSFDLDPQLFPYGYAKWQAELAARQIAGDNLELVILNPSIVLGAGDINQISGTLVIESARGHIPFYPVGGANFVHIDDVAIGHLAAAEHGRAGERYILGGENLTYQRLLTTLAQVSGSAPPRIRIPPWLSGPAAWFTALYGRLVGVRVDPNLIRLSRYHIYCDRSKAQRELGLADVRSFRQAAREAYEWYREQGVLE